jgi:hypothetical protein
MWSFGGEAGTNVAGTPASVNANVSTGSGAAGAENLHLWVAGVMLAALLLLIFGHVSGFRFATDVGVTRG